MQTLLAPPHDATPHAACLDFPCAACKLAWCDAPWSSGRTGCPACVGRNS